MKQIAKGKTKEPTIRRNYRIEQSYLDKLERIRRAIGLPNEIDALKYAITQANRIVR
jgi:hypothetical protein